VPLVSVEHQYVLTEPFTPEVPRTLPTLRDPDRLTYYKEEVGGLVMGGYEPNPVPWAVRGFPKPFEFQLLGSDWDHFAPTMELAVGRVPALAEAGIRQLINGPESFTPDGNFILGEAPELPNLFVGAGFNAFGIAAGGGAGQALAEWVHDGAPPFDLWVVDLRRFGARTPTPNGYAPAPSRPTRSTTRWPGRTRSITVAARRASRRCTTGWLRPAPCSARSSAGSDPTGSTTPRSANLHVTN
jgi:glycine/D-amino acid oxidase-like deaminating enzyme